MAEVAHGLSSPCCGTFSTVAGNKSDENLSGSCGRCMRPITAPNPQYVKPAEGGKEQSISFHVKQQDGSDATVTVTGKDLKLADISGFNLERGPGSGIRVDGPNSPDVQVGGNTVTAGPIDTHGVLGDNSGGGEIPLSDKPFGGNVSPNVNPAATTAPGYHSSLEETGVAWDSVGSYPEGMKQDNPDVGPTADAGSPQPGSAPKPPQIDDQTKGEYASKTDSQLAPSRRDNLEATAWPAPVDDARGGTSL